MVSLKDILARFRGRGFAPIDIASIVFFRIAFGSLLVWHNPHWRLRTQYQFVDFGNIGFTRQDNFGEGFISHHSVDIREHVVQFAIVYGF